MCFVQGEEVDKQNHSDMNPVILQSAIIIYKLCLNVSQSISTISNEIMWIQMQY